MTSPALRLSDVRKVYRMGDSKVVALDHTTFTVAADEIVALVGPSGSGKTTLCSIAGGILSATEGSVTVGDERISDYSDRQLTTFRQHQMGFVFQSVNLVPFLTARKNTSSSTSWDDAKESGPGSGLTGSSLNSA